jgi:heat shock protein HtpX
MKNAFRTAMLLGALSAILLVTGELLGGQQGLVIAFGVAVAMNFGSYWFSDKIVLRVYRAREVGPDHPLRQLTRDLAQRAAIPMPRVYVIPGDTPNAFATGRNPKHAAVAATEGLLTLLGRNELTGVIAHELAHVRNRDILLSSIAATIAATIMMVSRFALFFGGGRGHRSANPVALIAMMILAPLAAVIIQAAISRSREFTADATGAEIAGRADGLANALRKIEAAAQRTPLPAGPVAQATAHMFIVKPFSGRGAVRLFSTHPPTEERIRRLMVLTQGQW